MKMNCNKSFILGITVSWMLSGALLSPAMAFEPVELHIARMSSTSGVDDAAPSLRWSTLADDKAFLQNAYSIRMASRPERLPEADVPGKYQGCSLLPIFNGKTPADWRTDHYHEHHMNNPSIPKWRGVRNERYSYACYYEQDFEFLHDLEVDPDQLKNFAADPEYKQILESLRARCDEFTQEYTRPEIVALKKVAGSAPEKTKKRRNKKNKASNGTDSMLQGG